MIDHTINEENDTRCCLRQFFFNSFCLWLIYNKNNTQKKTLAITMATTCVRLII